MFSSSPLFALLLAGVIQAAPATLSNTSTPAIESSTVFPQSTTISSGVPPAQSTTAPQNGTASAKFNGSSFTDVAPTINPNATLDAITKPDTIEPDLLFHFPTTCESLIEAKATQLAQNVGTPTSGYISDTNWGTVHKNYAWGAIYCYDVTAGAHAVYGDIWLKWSAENGDYGYPITDETGATDNVGTTIRYNVFSQSNAIYWTAAHGAFKIYGDIYQRWLSIGDVKSTVGYPITDETGSGSYGGRYNDFSNGMIYWHAGSSWVHVGALPDSLSWTWNPINLDDVTGSNTITISSNGNARWVSNIHDDVAIPFNWQVGWVLVNADGIPISLYQSGSCGPNFSGIPIFGGPTNDNNIDTTVNNAVINENWRAWVAWNDAQAAANNSLDIGDLLNEIIQAVKQVYPIVAAVIAVLS